MRFSCRGYSKRRVWPPGGVSALQHTSDPWSVLFQGDLRRSDVRGTIANLGVCLVPRSPVLGRPAKPLGGISFTSTLTPRDPWSLQASGRSGFLRLCRRPQLCSCGRRTVPQNRIFQNPGLALSRQLQAFAVPVPNPLWLRRPRSLLSRSYSGHRSLPLLDNRLGVTDLYLPAPSGRCIPTSYGVGRCGAFGGQEPRRRGWPAWPCCFGRAALPVEVADAPRASHVRGALPGPAVAGGTSGEKIAECVRA